MKRSEKVYNALVFLCKTSEHGVDTDAIALTAGVSRANASNELNKLVKEGRCYKNTARPVRYSVSPFISKNVLSMPALDLFSANNPSLEEQIRQAKAALLYPPNGINILIFGDTGTGKSMLAELIYEYAVDIKLLGKGSSFISFNCADYAKNSNLLTGQIFGVTRGAYTGADADKAGLLEKADGGILFLDEIHRLPPEGQEMFFHFLDKGLYRRLGDTSKERTAKVLIICATTEDPCSALLKTFKRRIPVVINMPLLHERTLEERYKLIQTFFYAEAKRVSKSISVSLDVLKSFMSYDCGGNIGQLKSDIQISTAKAYMDFVLNDHNEIFVNLNDIPTYVRHTTYNKTDFRDLWFMTSDVKLDKVTFDPAGEPSKLSIKFGSKTFVPRSFALGEDNATENAIKNLDIIIPGKILNSIVRGMSIITDRLNLSNSQKRNIAKFLNSCISEDSFFQHLNIDLNAVRTHNKDEFNLALRCLEVIERDIGVTIPLSCVGELALMLKVTEDIQPEKNIVSIVVLAHGESTATSMVNVANQLLFTEHAIGVDLPLSDTPNQAFERLQNILVDRNIAANDLLLLVDMGSLINFGKDIEKIFRIKTKTITMVSTMYVMEAVFGSISGKTLDEIYSDVLNLSVYKDIKRLPKPLYSKYEYLIYVDPDLGVSHTEQIKKYFPELRILISRKDLNTSVICALYKADKPSTDGIKYLKVGHKDDMIGTIRNLVERENIYNKIVETLSPKTKYLPVSETVANIKIFINAVEDKLNLQINNSSLTGLVLHISCLLDSILSDDYREISHKISFDEKYLEYESVFLSEIKKLNKLNGVDLPGSQHIYIMNLFFSN